MPRLTAHITGRVQGVGFRQYTVMKAHRLDLAGWVRNEGDGAVQVVAEGPREALEELLDAVRSGPPTAKVDDASASWEEAEGGFEGFRVRHG